MGDNLGWVPIHRSVQYHWLWKDKPFSKGQAWIDLIMLANHDDVKILQGDEIKTFKRGTVNRSILSLAERWGWDRKKVKRFLDALEVDGMLTQNASTQGTTLTLVKYAFYNDLRSTDDPTDGQRLPQRLPTNKNYNNYNNDNHSHNGRDVFGSNNNVFLSKEELQQLKQKYSAEAVLRKIESLSNYMIKHNTSYPNHFETLCRWLNKDLSKKVGEQNHESEVDRCKVFDPTEFM